MNGFPSLLSTVGWVLLHSLWQGALIGILWGVLRFLTRRYSAKTRYLVACVGMALLPVLPVLTVLYQPMANTVSQPGFSSIEATTSSWLPSAVLTDSGLDQGASPLHQAIEFFARVAPYLASLWALGVFVCLVRLLRSCWWLRTVRFQSYEPEETAWVNLLNELRNRLGISRPVRLLQSALVDVPTVIGWLRPIILLPFSSLVGLAPQQIEAILVHELAHIRRLDHFVNALQCLVETLMFYHPAASWLSKWVRDERENCCDDVVIAACGNRLAYARALASLEEFRAPLSPLALAANSGSLLNRVRRLLGMTVEPAPPTARKFFGMGLFLVGLLLILFGASLAFGRPTFQATARIKLDSDQALSANWEDRAARGDVYLRYFLQTQQALIGSRAVLSRAVENLDLRNIWSGKAAARPLTVEQLVVLLRKRLTIWPVRQTTLLEIRAADERPERAAAIANGVVNAYRSFLAEKGEETLAKGLQSAEDNWKQLEQRVQTKRSEVEQLRKQLNISEAYAQEGPPARFSAETLRRLEGLRIEAKSQITREETLLERLRALTQSELINALPTAAPDALLQSLLEQQSLVEQQLLVARKDFGPEHAEFAKAQSLAERLEQKIKRRAEGIIVGLTERLSAEKAKLASLEKEVRVTVQEEIDTAGRYNRYSEKKNELEEMQRLRQVLSMKSASERIDAALPRTSFVQVVDAAVAPDHPTPYSRPGSIGLILLGLLLDGISLSVLRGRPRLEAVAI